MIIVDKTMVGTPGMKAGVDVPRGLLYRWFGAQGITIPQQVIVPDISFYQVSADFAQMKANGARGVIIRAGQNAWPDPKFATFWKAAKAARLPRGTYFYYDSRVPPKGQADLFFDQFKADMPEMEIVADYEESYGGAYGGWQNLKKFLEQLHARGVPYSKMAIYTGYYYWRSNSSQTDPLELSYFKQFRLWLAWYTSNPDHVSIPAPWTNNDLLFWQFTSNGDGGAYGVDSKSIDLNYFNGKASDFEARYGAGSIPTEPPEDVQEPWFGGKGVLTSGYRSSPRPFYFHELRFKRVNVERTHINGIGFFGTAAYFWETRGKPDITINGGHADYSVSPPVPLALVVSDGDFQKSKTQEFSIQFDRQGGPLGMYWGKDPNAWNVVGVSDRLLIGGTIPTQVRLNEMIQRVRSILPLVDDTYVDPRTALFWNAEEYIIIVIDGRNNGTEGLTRLELAEFAKSRGALEGGNLDGGGSSSLLLSGTVKNNPPDGKLRSVANHIGFWIRDSGGSMNGVAKEKLGKTISVRSVPAARSGNKTGEIAPYSQFEFLRYTDDLDHPGDTNYRWVELASGGYANYIYPPNGLRLTIVQEPGSTPPAEGNKPFTLDVAGYKPFSGELEPDA